MSPRSLPNLPARRQQLAPNLPAFAASIFQLAWVATDDRAVAASLTLAVVPGAISKTAATDRLVGRINEMESPVPGLAQPQLSNGRRRQLLGRHTPSERLALGMYVLAGVPLATIEGMVAQPAVDTCLVDMISELGMDQELAQTRTTVQACQHHRRAMLDGDLERARLHTRSCSRCAAYLAGLHTALPTLRGWLDQTFPPQLPESGPLPDEAQPVHSRANTRRLAVVCAAVLLLFGLLTVKTESQRPVPYPPAASANNLLARALTRLESGLPGGVLRERIRVPSPAGQIIVERFSAASGAGLWLSVQREQSTLFQLVWDGNTRLKYTVVDDQHSPRTTVVDAPEVTRMQPILRQLPFTGPLGGLPELRGSGELGLLLAARRSTPVLMGTTEVRDRRAYLLGYQTSEPENQVILTLDAETFVLLRAIAVPASAGERSTVLWNTDLVEYPAVISPDLFKVDGLAMADAGPNPRHLLTQPFSNMALDHTTWPWIRLPLPRSAPVGTKLAFLRESDFFGITQTFEGDHFSAAILSPFPTLPVRPPPTLERKLNTLRWRVVRNDDRLGLVQIELAPAIDMLRRSQLYLWHAGLTPGERLAAAEAILATIEWTTPVEAMAFPNRFVPPPSQSLSLKANHYH